MSSFPNLQHKSNHQYYIPRWILDELHRILVYLNRTTSSSSISKIEQEQIAFISEHVFPIVLCGASCLDSSSSIVAAAFANLYQHHEQQQQTNVKRKLINSKKSNNSNNIINEERVIPQAILPVGCAEVLIKITSHKDLQRLFDDISSNGNTSNSNKIIPFDGDDDDKLLSLLLVTSSPIAIQVPFYEKYTSQTSSTTSSTNNNVVDQSVIKVEIERVLDYDEEEGKEETSKQTATTTAFRAYSDDDEDEDENHVNQTKQEQQRTDLIKLSSASSSSSTFFTINRSEYDPKTFSTEVVLKQKKHLISQINHDDRKSRQQQILGTFVRPSLVSSTNSSAISSNKTRSSTYHHEGCDLFILSSSLSANNNTPLPSHAQHELLLKQHPEFRSSSASSSTPIIKFEPVQLPLMATKHWCPILSVPSSPTIRAFLHRTLLLPPCPYLHPRHNPLLPFMKFLESTRGSSSNNNKHQQQSNSLLLDQEKQQQDGIRVVPFHLNNDSDDDDSRNLQFKSIARVAPEKRFCIYLSSLCHDVVDVDWQSMYLSILTVFSWITSFIPFANQLKKEALNVLVASTSQNALDSHHQIYKLQKIISLCDATKGGQYASSFVGSRNKSAQIGSVEAILSLRYLTTNKMIDDPFDIFAERHDEDYEEMFEFRTVRFELMERRRTMQSVEEKEKEKENDEPSEFDQQSLVVLLEFSIPRIFTRMLINHFDKTASPVIFEIELTRKVKKVVTILGVALSRCEEDKKEEENNLNILITDHRCSSSSSMTKWISVSDLIVDLIAESSADENDDDENDDEGEEPPIACVFVFPVVLAGAVL